MLISIVTQVLNEDEAIMPHLPTVITRFLSVKNTANCMYIATTIKVLHMQCLSKKLYCQIIIDVVKKTYIIVTRLLVQS